MFARNINHDPYRLHPGEVKCVKCHCQADDGMYCVNHKPFGAVSRTNLDEYLDKIVRERLAKREHEKRAEAYFLGVEIENGARMY